MTSEPERNDPGPTNLTPERKAEIEEEFKRLRAELDSAKGQARAQVRVRQVVEKHAREHAAFLARSRARGFTRVVR